MDKTDQRRHTIIGYKASDDELALLNEKVRASGLTRSDFLRKLVESATVEPVKITASVETRTGL